MKAITPEDSSRHLWFEQAGSLFAASMEYLQEISPLGQLRPLPTQECALAGLTTLREDVLPVFAPVSLLNPGHSPAKSSASLVVLKLPTGGCLGLLADAIGKIVSLPSLSPMDWSVRFPQVFSGVSGRGARSEILVLNVLELASLTGLNQAPDPASS